MSENIVIRKCGNGYDVKVYHCKVPVNAHRLVMRFFEFEPKTEMMNEEEFIVLWRDIGR